jgi:excisionase family DNA binding protein
MNVTWSENALQQKDALQRIMQTVQECADYSGMSPGGIRRLISEGRLPCVRIGVKCLVNRDVFIQFLQGTTSEPAVEEPKTGTIRRV